MQRERAEPIELGLFELGEGCRWDGDAGELWWVDVLAGDFYRARADGADLELVARTHLAGHLTCVAPVAPPGEGWIVSLTRSICHLLPDGSLRELAGPEHHNAPHVRMNDGVCDRRGRLWVGSMAYDNEPGAGSLYRFSMEDGVVTIRTGVTISNGIGWSPDGTTMYYVDSGAATIEAFEFDEEEGRVGAVRLVARLDADREGVPDGLCVDAEGALWVAIWGGGAVRRYSPDGELLGVVEMAATQPSSCAIGGADGATLYVTSARDGMSPSALAADPHAGCLFACPIGVAGLPLNRFRLS